MNRLTLILLLLLATLSASAREYGDTAIYQGINLKLDILTPVLEVARSKGQLQSYEVALNCRLAQRYFPTLELGYAFGKTGIDDRIYDGQGGFARVGLDLNGLKKNPNSQNALLVGLRFGGAYQKYDLMNVSMNDNYWQHCLTRNFMGQTRFDCWGEVVGGCQVQIAGGFTMGWYLRLKILMTRKAKEEGVLPYYVPGFGFRDDTNWGLSYYLGWKF